MNMHVGDQWPYHYPYPYPGTVGYGSATVGFYHAPLTEDRIREIFREELAKALEAIKRDA